jgi:hypothetical protein
MKKLFIGLFTLITIIGSAATIYAAPEKGKSTSVGPYEGVFHGRVYNSNGTSAPLTLKMTHRGDYVEGTAFLGQGLKVDAGICGSAVIPSATESAMGQTSTNNPRYLSATSSFNVRGVDVTVDLKSMVSTDGDSINAEAKIDLPWICGRDPVLTGTLLKAQ